MILRYQTQIILGKQEEKYFLELHTSVVNSVMNTLIFKFTMTQKYRSKIELKLKTQESLPKIFRETMFIHLTTFNNCLLSYRYVANDLSF